MSNTDTDPNQDFLRQMQSDHPNWGDSPEFLRRAQSGTLQQATPPTTPWQDDPNFKKLDYGYRPQQPRALPPAIGNFLGNIGAFVPSGTSPTPQQGTPPPQYPPPFVPNRRQMYVPSQANRPTTELGRPPRFPQKPDMWQVPGIYEGVGRQLGRWGGSQRTRLMAGNLSRFTNAYMQGSRNGQNEYTRIQHQHMIEAADLLERTMQTELQNYAVAYSSYSNDPNALHTDLMNRAGQLGDTEMQAALNMGPREAERLVQWRQAKLDDLSRGNTARKEHDEYLRARNPFMVNPVGSDGLPAERLPLPKGMDPHGLSMGERIKLVGAMPTPSDPDEFSGRVYQTPSYPENNPNQEELEGAGGRLGEPQPLRPTRPMPWMDLPPDERDARDEVGGEPDEKGYAREGTQPQKIPPERVYPKIPTKPPTKIDPEKGPETDEEFEEQEQQDKDFESSHQDEIQKRYEREQYQYLKDQGQERASRDGKVRLAQADTGTMSDAGPVKLPQITVKSGDEAEEEDPTDVWDRVEINRRAREARERRGTGDQPGGQPPSPAGAQPPAASPDEQRQGGAGQRGQGQPAGTAAQAPDQTVPPAATAPVPKAKAPAPGVSQAADNARAAGQNPDFIEGFGSQVAIGQLSVNGLNRSGIKAEERAAILHRAQEIRNGMFGIVNDPNLKEGDAEAIYAAIKKQNPQVESEIRGLVKGEIAPKKDTPYWAYLLAHKIDPNINETTFKGRSEALKQHTSGKMGENKMKLGTAMYHADRLLKNLDKLPNLRIIGERGALRMVPFVGGSLADKAFPEESRILNEIQTDIDTLNNEYHNVMAYRGNGTLSERKDLNARMNYAEPNALRGTVTEMIEEMKGRNYELKRNFEVTYGGNYGGVMRNYNLVGNQQGADEDDRSFSDQGNRLLDQSGNPRPKPSGRPSGQDRAIPYDEYFK